MLVSRRRWQSSISLAMMANERCGRQRLY
jgi:hypothetical protein